MLDKEKEAAVEMNEVVETTPRQPTNKERFYDIVSTASYVLGCVLGAYLMFHVIFTLGMVQGDSMEPTLSSGDVFISRRFGPVDYGDIVVVDSDARGYQLIKRVIGLPGDTIAIDTVEGVVYRNGMTLDEPYVMEPTYTGLHDGLTSVTLEDGEYFVMGDNRNHSGDSRNADIGAVEKGDIFSILFFHVDLTPWD